MPNEETGLKKGEEGYKLAYDEAVRALSEQRATFDSIRTRTGIVLSAAAISTSFLGSQALTRSGWVEWNILAALAFFGVGVTALAVIWPVGRSEGLEGFAADPEVLIATYIEGAEPFPLADIYRNLSLHMRESYDKNEQDLKLRVRLIRGCSILLVVEIGLWAVGLTD